MTREKALEEIVCAAKNWASELDQWIIPGADNDWDKEGYEEELKELNQALRIIQP